MPLQLDNNDIVIIKALLKDGRKSFRQISRETGITTPTVKARYERLVNVGFIKGVLPVFDFNKVNKTQEDVIQIKRINEDNVIKEIEDFDKKNKENIFQEDIHNIEKKLQMDLQ